MSHPIRIWSKAYSPSPDTSSFHVQVDKSIWSEAMRSESTQRKFLRILHPEGLDDWIAPLGEPILSDHGESKEDPVQNIYLPLWMVDAAQLIGQGEESLLDILDEEAFEKATRIVFRVVDSAFYNADVKEELEHALSSLGVIRQHTSLQIPVQALGGFAVEVFIAKTEPSNVVLCEGEEVAVEFEEPIDQIEPPRPPTPIPAPTPMLVPDAFLSNEQMIPATAAQTQGFRAFQGVGHVVGSSNANIPEWRRGLPPPPRRNY